MDQPQQQSVPENPPPPVYPHVRRSTSVEGMVNTVEWVLVALILAFTFRAFVMEAFRIPTGSMAETLRGAHYFIRCTRCGFRFDVGADSYATKRCPSCGYDIPDSDSVHVSNGDRILVLKCLYQFTDPRRWDVVVFKNPTDPAENYIKRMIALPGETVEIVDGDIYINGKIARKPPKVQQELWMPIYENDYQPTPAMLKTRKHKRWSQPFQSEPGSNWNISSESTVFTLQSPPDVVNTAAFETSDRINFKASYGYNSGLEAGIMPVCSDLMLKFRVLPHNHEGFIGAKLKKYDTEYMASADFNGMLTISKIENGIATTIDQKQVHPADLKKATLFSFANVDHTLILQLGDSKLSVILGDTPDSVGTDTGFNGPSAKIIAAGSLELMHIGLYRDTHYMSDNIERAGPGNPFTLNKDEFFVCGDNSPNSSDARLWSSPGKGNGSKIYRAGTVPRDYLMGKAFFIYWSNAFTPFPQNEREDVRIPFIPNISQIGFIDGGDSDCK